MPDVSQAANTLTIVQQVLGILGTVVAFGMVIQQVRRLTQDVRELHDELRQHVNDRSIHHDIPNLAVRIGHLEGRRRDAES